MSTTDPRFLDDLDLEAQALIGSGNWTREAFLDLWSRGRDFVGDRENLLDFLSSLADPSWLPASDEEWRRPTMTRIPRHVTRLIYDLLDGWRPRVELPVARAFSWKGWDPAEVEARVAFEKDDLTVLVRLPESEYRAFDALNQPQIGSIIRDPLALTWPGSWTFDCAVGYPRRWKLAHGSHLDITFGVSQWTMKRIGSVPRLWMASIPSIERILLGNLDISRDVLIDQVEVSGTHGWGHLRLDGNNTYYLIQVKNRTGPTEGFLIVDCSSSETIDSQAFADDLRAMQFVLGQTLQIGTLYGVEEGQAVALTQHQEPSLRRNRRFWMPAVPLRDRDPYSACASLYFRKLSSSMKTKAVPRLYLPIENAIDTSSMLADQEATLLHAAIRGFCSSLLGAAAPARPSGNEWYAAMLPMVGLPLPGDVLARLDMLRDRLERTALLSLVEPDQMTDAAKRESWDHVRELRSVLVALVAIAIGYRGPILASDFDERSPAWWPEETVSADPPFIAVNAPTTRSLGLDQAGFVIVVAARNHEAIIRGLLRAAGLDRPELKIVSVPGRNAVRDLARFASAATAKVSFVLSSSVASLPDATRAIVKELDGPAAKVFPAVSSVEAWLLADDLLLSRIVGDDRYRSEYLNMLPRPEEVPDAYSAVTALFGTTDPWDRASEVDIVRASARSPSLRHFLSGIAELVGTTLDLQLESTLQIVDLEVFAGLLREMMSDETVVWQTLDGHKWSARELAQAIETGTTPGRQYARDVLRVAIDFLRRQAKREGRG